MTEMCRVVGCGELQHGEPLCSEHWRLHFLGFCVVGGCGIKPRGDAFACRQHGGVWQRTDNPPRVAKSDGPPKIRPRTVRPDIAARNDRIWALRAEGMTYNAIAAEVNCSISTVGNIITEFRGRLAAQAGSGTLAGDLDVIDSVHACEVCGSPVSLHRKSRWCSRTCQDQAWQEQEQSGGCHD